MCIRLPLSSKPNASGLALTEDGFDEPIGYMPWTGFLPAGRIRAEFLGAVHSEAALLESWKRRLDLAAGLVLTRELKKALEQPIQDSWDARVRAWFPPFEDSMRRSTNARPSTLSVPITIAQSCKIDYLRLVEVKLPHSTSAAAAAAVDASSAASFPAIASVITAVAELKNSLYHPNDGEPQALVAAFSAILDLHSKGLPPSDCVVPFILNTGVLEQHGVAYLIGTAPCAVMTTPVVDLTDLSGQRFIAGARLAFVNIARRTEELILQLPRESLESSVSICPSLDPRLFFWKKPLPIFGKLAVPHAVLHQLHVFHALSESAAAEHIAEPVAVLMQSPPGRAAERAVSRREMQSGPVGAAAGAASLSSQTSSAAPAEEWLRETTMVFPRLHGFITGVPAPGHEHRTVVLAAVQLALRRFHAAGLVHMDLFSSNVMWRMADQPGASPVVCVRLVDLDASLFVGQPVPPNVARVIDYNGHTGSYHPSVFTDGQAAIADFDWWHFALLSDDSCPFSVSGSAADLRSWLSHEGARARVLERVHFELAGEERAERLLRGGAEALSDSFAALVSQDEGRSDLQAHADAAMQALLGQQSLYSGASALSPTKRLRRDG